VARIRTYRDLGCLVTGASSGIGREVARLLAGEGARVVVTARRADRLEALALELRERGAAAAFAVPEDLADPGAPERLVAESQRLLGHVDVLVNDAGYSVPGLFSRTDSDETRRMVEVNVLAALELARRLLPGMTERRSGGVLNVSSMTGFQGTPYQSGYAGTKAFLTMWSESVHFEALPHGVHVTVLCPGVTDTEFFEASGYRHLGKYFRWRTDATKVARIGLRSLAKGKMTVVTGPLNRTLHFLERIFTRRFVVRVCRRLMASRPPPERRTRGG
jgi:short-subunit dehydrogenase